MTTRSRRTYDHRVKEQIIRTRNPDRFPALCTPRATALSWIRRGLGEVVSFDDDREKGAVLRDHINKLESSRHNGRMSPSNRYGANPKPGSALIGERWTPRNS